MKVLIALSILILLATAMVFAAQAWVGRLYSNGPNDWEFHLFNGDVYQIVNPDFSGIDKHRGQTVKLYGTLNGDELTVSKLETVMPTDLLKRLFPTAGGFSEEEGDPPHFDVYATDPRANPSAKIIGFAFWTADVAPYDEGYSGVIYMLAGMDISGKLTGVIMVGDPEPYGNRSIDRPQFVAQFKGKSIRAPFKVGGDIDAVSGATITVEGATRAIKDSARQVAMKFLTPDAVR
jgi:Na+-translocating ferredoxin:NAD+ oxidoreductase RnfG subunit